MHIYIYIYIHEATMPSRAHQVFESFAKYVGDAAQSEEQWPIAIRMATRLLQESQNHSPRGGNRQGNIIGMWGPIEYPI